MHTLKSLFEVVGVTSLAWTPMIAYSTNYGSPNVNKSILFLHNEGKSYSWDEVKSIWRGKKLLVQSATGMKAFVRLARLRVIHPFALESTLIKLRTLNF